MANIPPLPSGKDLATGIVATPTTRSYGPRLKATTVPGELSTLHTQAGDKLALVRALGRFEVELSKLDDTSVPYVNKFLVGCDYEVIKNWRTGEYRFKRATKGAVAHAASIATTVPQPKAETSTVAMSIPQPKAATITIAATTESPTPTSATNVVDPIPGMIYPLGKAKMKGAGRGWTSVDGIIVANDDLATLNDAWTARQNGEVGSVLVTGPAGTAKTLMVQAFAASLGVPFLKVDCGAVRTADDWSGTFRQDPSTKTWAHKWAPFALALRAGQPCIIQLDELTRTESPAALNALLGLLDETGTLLVPDANTVLRLPRGVMVVATANIGPEFVGTLPLDGAVRQRFPYGVRMTYTTEATEAKLLVERTGISRETADALVRMAVQQRLHRDDATLYPSGGVISTRLVLNMAQSMGRGRPAREAIWAVLKGQFDPADDTALSVIVDVQFPATPVVSAPDAGTPATFVAERHWYQQSGIGCARLLSDGSTCGRNETDSIHFGGSNSNP